jgi:protein-S-isoprenylcysteine O-methyltransferase Ste14
MKSYLFKQLAGSLVFFVILFLSAGRLDYWQGWVYVAVGLVMFTLNYTVFRLDPELLKERSKPGEGTKKWEKLILGLSFLGSLAMYVVAGLDSGRFHWTPDMGYYPVIPGIALVIAGQLMFLIAEKQNRFFSSVLRIQREREHTVCETGLYRFVRHPAYMGLVIQSVGFPLLMGSQWSIIPAGVLILLVLIRTCLEDRTLLKELNGYAEYAKKTKYRILPMIW